MDLAALQQTLDPTTYALVCALKESHDEQCQANEAQRAEIAALTAQIASLRDMLFGRKSEKLPPIDSEVRRAVEEQELFAQAAQGEEAAPASDATRQKQRRKKARKKSDVARKKKRGLRKNLPVLTEQIQVTAQDLPTGMTLEDFRSVGDGSNVVRRIEHVREHLVSVEYILQTLVSKDGDTIITAKAPDAVIEGGHYGPGVYAHAVVSKCCDSMPLYRIARIFERAGFRIARSTLCSLFHRTASQLEGIYRRLVAIAKQAPYVGADETRHPMLKPGGCVTGWIWTLHCDDVISYVFSDSRSSQVAKDLLDETTGYLQVDGYSAYNAVCGKNGRTRVGCWSHSRRLFFKALGEDEEAARTVLNWILDLYLVEYEAASQEVLGTIDHLLLRQEKSQPILDTIKIWMAEHKEAYPPKGRMCKAIGYAQNQWEALTQFTKDPKLRLDNNLSENALRIMALGRKNFLFVGHEEGGQNLAILQTIVATCRLHDVNPYEYIKDVLIRVQRHPNKQIDQLLPQNWKTIFAQPP